MWCALQTFALVLLQFVGHYPALFVPLNQDYSDSERTSEGLCLTPGCVKAAAQILDSIDASINPCDDFYQFACGGWIDSHTIPEDKSSVSVFSEISENLRNKLRVLLDKPLTGSEPAFIKSAKNMYDACMDVKTIEDLGDKPLRNILKFIGGWPVLEGEKWDASKFDWIDMLIKFRSIGFEHNILVYVSVVTDTRNNTYRILELDEPALALPGREYYTAGFNDSVTMAYFDLMVTVASKLGADDTVAEDELLKVFEFETELAKHTLSLEETRNASALYNKYTVRELKEMAPQVDWLRLINGVLNNNIEEDELLIVPVPTYLRNFSRIIASTDKRVLANYMVWRLVVIGIQFLSNEWRSTLDDYATALTGVTKDPPRWKHCFAMVKSDFSLAISSYYVRNHFKKESKDSAMKILKYIQKDFLNVLRAVDWMDEETRKKAVEKANSMSAWIGYPDEILNDDLVAERYANVSLGNTSYLGNYLKMEKRSYDRAYSQLRERRIKGDWKRHAHAAVVNAFYNPVENSIDFPAGILQSPFFSVDRPNYLNFGGIGFVIGHEITHGFDDEGKQFDKDGNNNNWWNPDTDEKFKKKAQCIIDQYSNYTVPQVGESINGINTQGENIADNGGIKEAYRAYQSWVADNGEEPTLPALNYTASQLFWINAANVWCGKIRDASLKSNLKTDPHSPGMFRIIGSFSNSNEFANDFHCRPGSPMNPESKCEVW